MYIVPNNSQPPVPGSSQNSKGCFRHLNIFPSTPPSIDEHERRIQRISTVLFILLFISSMTIILVYTFRLNITTTKTEIINVQTPSLVQYLQLNTVYVQTLECPCSTASVDYEKFLHIEYLLHQVCSSVFVDQSWIDYLQAHNETTMFPTDFRRTSSSSFQALKTFCQLSDRTISNNLLQFYSNKYISTSVVSPQLFQSQIQLIVDRFRWSMASSFSLSLSMIRNITQVNALLSGLETNYYSRITNDDIVETVPMNYSGCSCSTSSQCITQSSIYQYPDMIVEFDIPGFYRGCFVTEALLQSNLQCFYNQTCINQLQTYLTSSSPMNVIALDSSLANRYAMNSPISELIDNLMIEEWQVSSLYDRYYSECQPSHCTYTAANVDTVDTLDILNTYEIRNNIIYIIIMILAIIGGLSTILRCVVPLLVRPIMHCFGKRRRGIIPAISAVYT